MSKNMKFGLICVVILGTLAWLAAGGISETATYYKEIAELQAMGQDGVNQRLRVGGDVLGDSIVREGDKVHFTLVQEDLTLDVIYAGVDPLPDTFRDGAQALADGTLDANGVFHATKIQAKCASKYEVKPAGAVTRG